MAKYITPAVTPFLEDGTIDIKGAQALYEHLVAGGIDGILIFGSIGEFFAVPVGQKKQLVQAAVSQIAGRVQLIVGTADMIVDNVISFSNWALDAGADAVMVVPPYYFWLDGTQIEEYFDYLARKIHGKVYLYNFPDRMGYTIPPAVVRSLAQKHPNIAGMKDTITGMDHTREVIKAVKPVRPDFEVFSGFDDNFAHNVLSGGDGCISGTSNFAPTFCSGWVDAVKREDWDASAKYQQKMNRLMDIYSIGSSFVPVIKKAAQMCGVPISARSSFPFREPDEKQEKKLREILEQEGIL